MADQERQYYTAHEVADLAEVTVQGVYKWIRAGKLEAYQFGRAWRIPRAAWETFKASGHSRPSDKEAAAGNDPA